MTDITISAEASPSLLHIANSYFEQLVALIDSVLFYPVPFPGAPDGFPFLVLWLVLGGLFFTFRFGFVNFRLIPHGIAVVRGKYDSPDEKGEISHFQALAAAISGTTGLGNIAGVAFAVTIGGPGAIIWMILAALFGTATKLAEVTVGHKYRKIDPKTGKVSGGGFHYLQEIMTNRGKPAFGRFLAIFFAICCIGGSVAGGNMLQSNQAVAIAVNSYRFLEGTEVILSIALAVFTFIILVGGIKRIARVAEKIVPLMAAIYVIAALVVLWVNAHNILPAFELMFTSAFSAESATGGLIGAMIAGFKRAFFSNEAGVGSAPIAHAAVKTNEPVREGCVALLEPLIDTVLVCTMTGLVLIISGVYAQPDMGEGVTLTASAFATVIPWFPKVLAVCVLMFAFSTLITWSYYGERAWSYLFGKRSNIIYYIFFCSLTFFGGLVNLKAVIDFGDLLLLSMAIPNLIGLFIIHNEIADDIRQYREKYLSKKKGT